MTTPKTIDRITETLHHSALGWLLPNLRQDLVVWKGLNEASFFEKYLQIKPEGQAYLPEDFSPSKLALFALDQTALSQPEAQNLFDRLDPELIHKARRSLQDPTILHAHPQDLASAGLLALALADSYHETQSWQGLLNRLPLEAYKTWLAPLACLLGYVADASGLLKALVQPAASSTRLGLAVHAVLSNPMAQSDQVGSLISLCSGTYGDLLPAIDRLNLVREIYDQRPNTAVDFCRKWLELQPEYTSQINDRHLTTTRNFSQLAEILFQIEARAMAGQLEDLDDLLAQENTLRQYLYTDLVNWSAMQKSRWMLERSSLQDQVDIFKRVIEFSGLSQSKHNYAALQAKFALTLTNQGKMDEASQLLPPPEAPLPDEIDILYAIARLACQSGNLPLSGRAVAKIIVLLEPATTLDEVPVWGESFSLVNFGKLLLDLDQPAEATRFFNLALQTCPNDADLLVLQADSYRGSHLDLQAAETLHVLVSLNPERLDYRRDFAGSLAEIEDWEACLRERSKILAVAHDKDAPACPKDIYAYAHCALKASQPELSLKVCTEMLSNNPDDSQALIYAGQAHLQLNDPDQGLACLVHATQVSPHLDEAWLALADAQQKTHPLATVVETLKNAIQAVPDCASIHFALGKLYLQDNAPTLALPDLRAALALSPDDPHILLKLGQALRLLGHNDEAKEVLSKAYTLAPQLPDLAELFARLLVELGALEQAIAPLETLIGSKSLQDPDLYLEYARCVLRLHQQGSKTNPPMKALIALNEVLQLDPGLVEARALTAEALAANGENEMAFQAYREALDSCLTEDKHWLERLSYGFGCVASSLGKHEIAIAALQEAGQANPDNPAIFMALSEAYDDAHLPEDALRAARNVLVIDGDNPDALAWFARQVANFIQAGKPDLSTAGQAGTIGLPSEALSALNQAIQLAPTRTDLLLQLGDLYSSLGAPQEAKVIFTSIAAFDFATLDNLKAASEYLSAAGEHASAIECLEKACTLDQASTDKHQASVYVSLAQEYVNNHDHSSAINTLDRALQLIPHAQALIALKIDILLGLGQSIEALHCIENALQDSPDGKLNVDLLFLASRINRSMGDFLAALRYARMGAESTSKPRTGDQSSQLPLAYRAQMAELYRALLQYDQAYKLVQDEIDPQTSATTSEQAYLDYIFLQAELALETGAPIQPAIQEVKLEPTHASFSRWMAIKARLLNTAGNARQAGQVFQLAVQKTLEADPAQLPHWSAPYSKYITLISLIEAAFELGQWEQASTCTQQVHGLTTAEPLPHLYRARERILRAEFTRLCASFEVTKHIPAQHGLSQEDFDQCSHDLDQAKADLEAYQNQQAPHEQGLSYDQIYRWQARAAIAFERQAETQPDPREVLAHHTTCGDAVALITHLHHLDLRDPDGDALTTMIKLARTYPKNPAVILQVALVLNDHNPANAMKSLQSVLQSNPFSKSPTIACCNLLLARIALDLGELEIGQQAVEAAIEFWADEPGWHALASRIYRQARDLNSATSHLLEASKLSPKTSMYHMDLGKLYIENAHEDARLLDQAVKCFKSALALDQNDVDALVNLATTQKLLNDLGKAESSARSALLLAPNRADIYQLLSEISIRNNDYQLAYEYANKAILTNPKDLQSTLVLVKSLSALGRHEEALAKLMSVIPSAQEPMALHLERVNILRKKDGPRQAVHELRLLTNAYPDEFAILNALSKAYLELGESHNAVSAAQQALNVCGEQTPHNEQADLHLLIGQVLRQSGELEASIQHLGAAIQLTPDRLEPYLELGLARKERREYQQALQIFERATQIAPDDPRAPFQAGLALKESKDYKSSETMLRRAVSLAPNDLTIRRQLAAVVALNLVHNPRSARIYAK